MERKREMNDALRNGERDSYAFLVFQNAWSNSPQPPLPTMHSVCGTNAPPPPLGLKHSRIRQTRVSYPDP